MKNPPKLLFVLPNLFTVSSIFCGLYAIIEATTGADSDRFYKAAVAIVFAMIFDSADGRVARITKTQSDFGIQLDSLADLISFGVAPAVLMHQWALADFGWLGMGVAFAYATCGALRLARFNVLAAASTGGPMNFVGLPIPWAAASLASLVMLHFRTGGFRLENQPLIIVVVGLLALLMVSNVPYRSFKKLKANGRTVSLLIALVAGVLFAAVMTSFSFMFVVVTAGFISIGLAEALVHLLGRHLPGRQLPPDSEEEEENDPHSHQDLPSP